MFHWAIMCIFSPNYEEFGNDKIVSKALDDRICAIMLDLIMI